MNRLTTREPDGAVVVPSAGYKEYFKLMVMRLAKYEDAEEMGRLKNLPCRIGDVMWAIRCYKGTIYAQKGFVSEMFFTKDMTLLIVVKNVARGEFGKKIFYTKEDAEEKIKQMAEG